MRLRIAQDKARARRWAERGKERNTSAILPTEDCMVTAVAVSTHECQDNHQVLQDLRAKRLGSLQELSDLYIAIKVIRSTYK